MDVRVKAASADFGLASSWLPVQPITLGRDTLNIGVWLYRRV
nr:MAG TPA: hypothetical protein [Caudoviricetes sp.]